MTVDEFILQLKKVAPIRRIDFLLQHLQDEFWKNIDDYSALKIFRNCVVGFAYRNIHISGVTEVELFEILYERGCFNKIIATFNSNHIITSDVLKLISVCNGLLNTRFSGSLKFKTAKIFYKFLDSIQHYKGGLNFVGVEKYLNMQTLSSIYQQPPVHIINQFKKHNIQLFEILKKLIIYANKNIIRTFNTNHVFDANIAYLYNIIPDIQTVLKPPYMFKDIEQFYNLFFPYDSKSPLLKYFDTHVNSLQINNGECHGNTSFGVLYIIYNCLADNYKNLYNTLIDIIAKANTPNQIDVLIDILQSPQYNFKSLFGGGNVDEYCNKVVSDLSTACFKYSAPNDVTADDIKDLFDI